MQHRALLREYRALLMEYRDFVMSVRVCLWLGANEKVARVSRVNRALGRSIGLCGCNTGLF